MEGVTIINEDFVIVSRGMTLQPQQYHSIQNGITYGSRREPGEDIKDTVKRVKGFVDEVLDECFTEDIETFKRRKDKLRG